MKKLVAVFAAVTALSAQANETLTVAASAVPHAELLEFVKPALAKEGVDLKVKAFTDYIQPNVQVAEKRLDANFFQPLVYLKKFAADQKLDITELVQGPIAPMGVYSPKRKTLAEAQEGDRVTLPNDPSHPPRALLLPQPRRPEARR